MTQEIVDSMRVKGQVFSILEVGANEHKRLEHFLPNDKIIYLDNNLNENLQKDSSFIKADATDIPFEDESFDLLINLDVYEHIKQNQRKIFLDELVRVSKFGFILAAPFNRKELIDAEEKANLFYKELYRNDYKWLEEHSINGLPNLEDTLKYLKVKSKYCFTFQHGSLLIWESMIKIHFATLLQPLYINKREILDKHYNNNIYPIDCNKPCYRDFIIFIKELHKPKANLIKAWLKNAEKSYYNFDELAEFYRLIELFFTDTIVHLKKIQDQANIELSSKAQEIEHKDQLSKLANSELSSKAQEIEHKDQLLKQANIELSSKAQEVEHKDQLLKQANIELSSKAQEVEHKDQLLNDILNSNSWRITSPFRLAGRNARKAIKLFLYLPRLTEKGYGSMRQEGIRSTWKKIKKNLTTERYGHNDNYEIWMKINGLSAEDYIKIQNNIKELHYKPLISIILPVYNTKEKWLRKCINSVINQLYNNWELCIADDASTEPHIRKVLEEYMEKDNRIKIVFREINGHISIASNSALTLAKGEFIALLDHDDELTADALYENVLLLNKNPKADIIYSDEDKIDEKSKKHDPLFKPDWSPDTILSQMYICHLGVYRTSLVKEVNGFREGFEGAQDHDLVLRLIEKTSEIYHIHKVLYSWRLTSNSTSCNPSSKPYAHKAGLDAINSYLDRVHGNQNVICEETGVTYVYNIRYRIADKPKVSIIVPTKDHLGYLKKCVKSIIDKSTYSNYEIIIINNNSNQIETIKWFEQVASEKIKIINAPYDFNWAKLNNHGINVADGEVYIFLNNDTEVISEDWLERLIENALRNDVGTVGGLLLYKDKTIQHAGVVVGMNGWADHVYKGLKPIHRGTPYLSPAIKRNVLAVTGACLAVSKDTINKIGGFNEDFIQCGSDVEFSIRAYKNGLYNVYDPHVRLYHYESKTRNPKAIPKSDFEQSAIFYKQYIMDGDPFYNRNLSLSSVIPALK